MGEPPRDPRHPAFLYVSYQLGESLLQLHQDDLPATKLFRLLSHEIKSFHASYQIIRPYLQPPIPFMTEAGTTLVRNIHDGVMKICEDIAQHVQGFRPQFEQSAKGTKKRGSYYYILHRARPANKDRNQRIQNFLEGKRNYSLERCQLRYANLLLNLLLAVLAYARYIHDDDEIAFPDASNFLVTDLIKTLAELRSKEVCEKEVRGGLSVEVSWWWDGLSSLPPNAEGLSPLAELSHIWVKNEARWMAHPHPDVSKAYDLVKQWREYTENLQAWSQGELLQRNTRIEELTLRNANLEATIADLMEENADVKHDRDQYAINNAEMRDMITELHGNIRQLKKDLAVERTARFKQTRSEEKRASRHRSDYSHLQGKYEVLLSAKESSDREAGKWKQNYEDILEELQTRRRHHDRSQEAHRDSHSKRPSRSHQGPPVSYDTQNHSRRHSSSSRRSAGSHHRSSGSSTVYDEDARHHRYPSPMDSPKAPPVPRHTRPFRS